MLSDSDVPLVHSVSYGWQGNLSEIGCHVEDVAVIEDDFAKLALKGISIIVASGDDGSGVHTPSFQCISSYNYNLELQGEVLMTMSEPLIGCCVDAGKYGGAGFTFYKVHNSAGNCTIFSSVTGTRGNNDAISWGSVGAGPVLWPSWPASSPWVTSVGATYFLHNSDRSEEVAVENFGSGGGFSAMYDRPQWQANVVEHYLQDSTKESPYPPPGSFPPAGRATPDVSALGQAFRVLQSGELSSAAGTSASTPVFAGLVSLLNEARLQRGQQPMGFLNPWIYKHSADFIAVTKGTNAISRNNGPTSYGFNCTDGWDPVTGLGTPRFDKLLLSAEQESVLVV